MFHACAYRLIEYYGYVETDNDYDNEIDRNSISISRTRVLVQPAPYRDGMRSTRR